MTVLDKGIGEDDKTSVIEGITNTIHAISYSEITGKGVLSKIVPQVIDTIQNLLLVRSTIINSRKIVKTKKVFIELADKFNDCESEIELKRLFDSYFATKSISYYTCGASCELLGNKISYKIQGDEEKTKRVRRNITKDFNNKEKEEIVSLKESIKNKTKEKTNIINNLFIDDKLTSRVYTTDEFNFLLNIYHSATFIDYDHDKQARLTAYRDRRVGDLEIYIKVSKSDFNTIWVSPGRRRTYFNKNVEVWLEKNEESVER